MVELDTERYVGKYDELLSATHIETALKDTLTRLADAIRNQFGSDNTLGCNCKQTVNIKATEAMIWERTQPESATATAYEVTVCDMAEPFRKIWRKSDLCDAVISKTLIRFQAAIDTFPEDSLERAIGNLQVLPFLHTVLNTLKGV